MLFHLQMESLGALHSAKGGAVETGCSGLHDVIVVLLYNIMDVQTYPKRFLPELNKTQ